MKFYKCTVGLGLSAMLLTTAVVANELSENNFCGFYTGGSVGGSLKNSRVVTSSNSTFNISDEDGSTRLSNNTSAKHAQRKSSAAAALYAGYGHVFQDLYFGVEAFLNYANYNAKSKKDSVDRFSLTNDAGNTDEISRNSSARLKTKLRNFEPGVDFRPGLFLNPCMLVYGRVGVAFNKISVRSTANNTLTITDEGDTSRFTSLLATRKNKNKTGLRLGIGLEHSLCDNITARADYVHTRYRGLKGTNTRVQNISDLMTITTANTVSVKNISNNTLMLGVSYYW